MVNVSIDLVTTNIWTAGVKPSCTLHSKIIEWESEESSFPTRNQSITTVQYLYLCLYIVCLLSSSRAAHLAVPAPSAQPKVIRERFSWSFGRSVLLICHRSTHQNKDHTVRLPSSCVVGGLWFGLIMSCWTWRKDYHIYEQWLWNRMCWRKNKQKKSSPFCWGGKTSSHVYSDTPSARNLQISSNCLLDLICPPCWTCLDIPSF